MGRVFTPEEVANGWIPRKEHFRQAETTFTGMAELALRGSGLVSAEIYGSWVSQPRRANARSDFDGILVYNGSPKGFNACRDIVARTAEDSQGLVPINVAAYSQSAFVNGRHEIDRFFGQHLTAGNRIVTGLDPATYMTFSDEHALYVLRNYLANQKRSLTERSMSQDPQEWASGLQRMLESPIAVGRKVLQVIDDLYETQLSPNDSTDKGAIADNSLEVFRQMKLDTHPRLVLFADNQYTEVLSATLTRDLTQSDYVGYLKELDEMVPNTVQWIDAVDAGIDEYLDVRFGN